MDALTELRAELLKSLADARGSSDPLALGTALADVSALNVTTRSYRAVEFTASEYDALVQHMVAVGTNTELAKALVVIGVSEGLEQIRLCKVGYMDLMEKL